MTEQENYMAQALALAREAAAAGEDDKEPLSEFVPKSPLSCYGA